MDLKELESGVNPHTHWYYQTKKIRLFKFFEERIVGQSQKITIIDVGAGSGFFSLELYRAYSEYIDRVLLVDLYYTDQEITDTKDSIVQKLHTIPFDVNNGFFILMDVIEHIEKDDQFIEEVLSKSKGRNLFYITVPAFQSLWSGHDVFLGHYRRYTLPQLRQLLGKEGVHLEKSYYQYALIFPIAWVIRKLANKSNQPQNDMKPVNPVINLILEKSLGFEMLIARINSLFGLTCTAEGYFY